MTDNHLSEKEWIDKTFEFEDDNAEHSLGNHWSPFFEDSTTIIKRLPEILANAIVQISAFDFKTQTRKLPENWPRAFNYVWPNRRKGVAITVLLEQNVNLAVSAFPFYKAGTQQTIVLEKVHVWKSEVEAQIECSIGGANIIFFDTDYATYRTEYEAGKTYDFILTGIAYSCRKAEDQIIHAFNPKLTDEFRKEHPEIAADWPESNTIPIHTKGMSAFIPIPGWDKDEYSFRGTVTEIAEIDMLDQTGWKVRIVILRGVYDDDREVDLDIIVTKKIWGDTPPPQVGDDVEGSLWLQGCFWCVISKV